MSNPSIRPIRAGVLQDSILGPILYSLHTQDIPQHPFTVLNMFADDKTILSVHPNRYHCLRKFSETHFHSMVEEMEKILFFDKQVEVFERIQGKII